ncbi:hypothetical protein IscW_ISCW003206 [Ixodes scapularis]|uniref:Uncharacterized protein n=1 Tax=Ixodes scapularis TaxID=6945 RepID=B7PBT3_IXOSC|nr:hypothetical protein IscW_ISCW003206 [Ixodes scapularis]|eukprot:XP_002408850.1 hypothetical protein IscW_ISCW003206 [Ixodes scapularis]
MMVSVVCSHNLQGNCETFCCTPGNLAWVAVFPTAISYRIDWSQQVYPKTIFYF